MNTSQPHPIIFLAFANQSTNPLLTLAEEQRKLEDILDTDKARSYCQFLSKANATLDDILNIFQKDRYRDSIAIFHYAGHANNYGLLLQDAESKPAIAYANGLAAFLAQQPSLQLVFLNGCATEPQVQGLFDAGVANVIATTRAVADTLATQFAIRFYKGLAEGLTIQIAYNQAVAESRSTYSDQIRHLTAAEADPNTSFDRSPWILHTRPNSDAADWSLPRAANDPLFGLPPLPPRDLPLSPYRNLQYYTAAEAELFFGRGRDIRDLYQRIVAPDTAPIILLYGQSGVGKSSLLEAGLYPRLSNSHTVLLIRRNAKLGLLVTLSQSIQTFLLPPATDLDLASAWRTIEQQSRKPLLVILDQVEECFTRAHPNLPAELDNLLTALATFLSNPDQRPRGKLILGFRKEWRAEIGDRLNYHKLKFIEHFLNRLELAGIIEVIQGPTQVPRLCNHYQLKIEGDLANNIANDLFADPGSPVATTLQILLTRLWTAAKGISNSQPRFDRTLYDQLKRSGIGLDNFFDEKLAELRQTQPDAVASGLILDLLALHTTPLGYAAEVAVEKLKNAYMHYPGVPSLVQQTKDLYLLTDQAGDQIIQSNDPVVRSSATRLVHDTLAPVVRARFDQSDAPGQRARRILESRSVDWKDPNQSGTPLDSQDLRLVESGISGMRTLSDVEQQLLTASRKAEAKRRLRIHILWTVGILLFVATFFSAVYAWIQSNLAHDRQIAAEQSEQHAQQERNRAEQQLLVSRSGEVAAVANSRLIAGDSQLALLLGAAALKKVTYTPQARAVTQAALEQWRQVAAFPGHTDMVTGIAFSRDNRYLATASVDDRARVWDLKTNQLLFVVDTHHADVSGAFFSIDNQYLITASRDNTIQTRTMPAGQIVYTLTLDFPVRSLAIHPDGNWFAVRSGNQVWLYDIATGHVVEKSPYELKDIDIRALTFTRDGKQILAGANDNQAHIWDIASGQHGSLQIDQGHQHAVTSVQQSNDRKFIASMSDDLLLLWEWDNGFQVRRLKQAGDGTLFRGQLEFSPDGRYLAVGSASGVIRLWDLSNLEADPYQLIGHTAEIKGIQYSPDGRLLASASRDGTVLLWNLTTRESIALVTHQNDNGSAPVFSYDGRLIATGDSKGTIHLWKVNYGGNIGYYPLLTYPAETAALSADQLVMVGEDGLLEFWRPHDGVVRAHKLSPARLTALANRPTTNLLAAGDAQGEIFLFDSRADTLLHSWTTHQGRISALLMLPVSSTFVTAGSDTTLQIWDWQTQQLSNTLAYHNRDVTSLVALPDASGFLSAGMDGAVVAWSLPRAESRLILQQEEPLLSLAVSPSGQTIAAGTTLEHIVVKDLTTDKAFSILVGTIVHALTFVDEHTLAVGGENGEIQLWDLNDRTVSKYNAHGKHWIRALIVSEDRRVLYSVGDDGLAKAWLLQNDDIFALACLRAGRSLTPAEWDDYFTFNISTNFCPPAAAPLTDTRMELPDPNFNDADQQRSNLPFILFFDTLNGTHVAKGETVTLRWHAENATGVHLEYADQSEGVAGIGSKTIAVDQPTTFRLKVENWFGVRTMEVTITPSS